MNSTKKLFSLVLIAAMLFALAACGQPTKPQPPIEQPAVPNDPAPAFPEKVQIGLIFPLSGADAMQGMFSVDGAQLAVDTINGAGGVKSLGGAQLELVVYDNESNSGNCKAVAERLVSENPDVLAVHGASANEYVVPMLSVFENAKVPFLTAQASQTITNQGYEYVFAFAAQSPQFAATQVALLQWLNETYKLDILNIGLVFEDTEWGQINSEAARKAIGAAPGLELVYDQPYTADSEDFSSLVASLIDAGCEVVFLTGQTQEAKLLFNIMASYYYSPLIIDGNAGFQYPLFAQELGDLAGGVLSVASHSYDAATIYGNDHMKEIGRQFEARFGYMMPEQGVSAYNAIYLISQALESCGATEGEAVRDAIRALSATSLTPGGALGFDAAGWNTNALAVMVQWQKDLDGKYRLHTVFPASEATAELQLTELLKGIAGQ